MTRVAFLGLGVMGFPMAGHLSAAGYDVCVYNRTTSVSQRWEQKHVGEAHSTPASAVADVDLACMCLGNDDDVRSVVYGDDGVLARLRPGSILVDHTTTSSELACELAQACHKHQINFLDAPVSGGQSGAEKGILTVMVGGDSDILTRAQPIIERYAQRVQLMGATGKGQQAKMVNQICVAGLLQALAEGLHFAIENDIDCDALLSTISKGAAQSWQMDNRGKTMVSNKFDFGFSVKWMIKDLQICLEQAQRSGTRLPMTTEILDRYRQLEQQGRGHCDTSSLIALLQKSE